MKLLCYVAAASVLATMARAKPGITNTSFNIKPSKPFALQLNGCDGGCTIKLLIDDSDTFNYVSTLASTVKGDSFTFTMDQGLPSALYAFEVIDNKSGEVGSLAQFQYTAGDGGGVGLDSTSSASDSASTTSAIESGSPRVTNSETSVTKTSGTSSDTATRSSSPHGGSDGLSSGSLAGIVVGVVGGVLLFLAGMFFWWRRKAGTSGQRHEEDASRPQVPELEVKARVELPATISKSLTEIGGLTQLPQAAELSSQGRTTELANTEQDSKKAGYSEITAAELHEQDRSPYSELPPETLKYEVDSNQQPSPDPPELPSSPVQRPSELDASLTSPSDSAPNTRAATTSAIGAEQPASAFNPAELASFVPQPSNKALLMDQYAQLEARRQRILELDWIEREQAELHQRLNEMATRKRE
ncbi:hypothetical protein MRS44_016963 [Fusarium solani]|uniref:Uncharacterized protein n=1 Tax=Fusarium solani TaxID=169388 RepID=A0A9P9GRS9_FUSSL|nr:uncharacterized protein B0J15DRAFT_552843 [Fusarium solani]KAH7243981.1 hypothetical protein B0J15DRAFT_552843 [Fusarium solani]KAJ3455481.1 hypothetical protein MRS44_016963 [Fusarium solani]